MACGNVLINTGVQCPQTKHDCGDYSERVSLELLYSYQTVSTGELWVNMAGGTVLCSPANSSSTQGPSPQEASTLEMVACTLCI